MHHLIRLLVALSAILVGSAVLAGHTHVKDIQATQDGEQVVVRYALIGTTRAEAEVLFDISRDGGRTWDEPKGRLQGDIGAGVAVGTRKRFTWAARTDFPDGIKSVLQLRVRTRAEQQASAAPPPAPGPAPAMPTGGVEPQMVAISGGCFLMGSHHHEPLRERDEHQHKVCVKDFKIGRFEVTQAQWQAVMGVNPSGYGGCAQCPVEQVSYNDIQRYLPKLKALTGKSYRLPTEAEWEYAARAGSTTPFFVGNCIGADQANFDSTVDYNNCGKSTPESKGRTSPVGSYAPNAWGLYDVAGNVWEWTCSVYESRYQGAETRCAGADTSGRDLVVRGGSWFSEPNWVRSATRLHDQPDTRDHDHGFRLVLD